jgi:hypothetical protein
MTKSTDGSYYKAFTVLLADKPITFHPALARIAGGAANGLLLSYLCHWALSNTAQDREGWFYQRAEDITENTGLTRYEQDTAKKVLKAAGVIETKVIGVPPITHYKVNIEKIAELLEGFNLLETNKSICGKPTNQFAGNAQSDLLETNIFLTVNKTDNNTVINRAPKTPEEYKARVQAALIKGMQEHDKSSARSTVQAPYLQPHIAPIAEEFMRLFGREPSDKGERAYWLGEWNEQYKMGIQEQDVTEAFYEMMSSGLTIKSPESLRAVAYKRVMLRRNGGARVAVATEHY